jgi:hypothetical protein
VTDPNGDPVVRAALGKLARPDYAWFEAATGAWRMKAPVHTELHVVDSRTGKAVATWLKGKIVLADGEVLRWVTTSFARRQSRLGGNLWVVKLSPIRGRFDASLSQTMLDREDRELIVGIASIVT